jgi:hypothetical protein
MRTDRQTYVEKLIVAFRNFANAPKNYNVKKKRLLRRLSLIFQGIVPIGYFLYILVFSVCLSEFDRERKHVATLSL